MPFPIVLSRKVYITTINLSNFPPHQGARLRLKCHVIECLARESWSFSSFRIFFNKLAAATNIFPSSEYILLALPLLAINRFKLLVNSHVSGLGNSSKKAARNKLHAYIATYAFISFFGFCKYNTNYTERCTALSSFSW